MADPLPPADPAMQPPPLINAFEGMPPASVVLAAQPDTQARLACLNRVRALAMELCEEGDAVANGLESSTADRGRQQNEKRKTGRRKAKRGGRNSLDVTPLPSFYAQTLARSLGDLPGSRRAKTAGILSFLRELWRQADGRSAAGAADATARVHEVVRVCVEGNPAGVVEALADMIPETACGLFAAAGEAGNTQPAETWFGMSAAQGLGPGAAALHAFATIHRSRYWDLLAWTSIRRSGAGGTVAVHERIISPIVAIHNPQRFEELDMGITMQNLTERCADFWRDPAVVEAVTANAVAFVGLDPDFFVRELTHLTLEHAGVRRFVRRSIMRGGDALLRHAFFASIGASTTLADVALLCGSLNAEGAHYAREEGGSAPWDPSSTAVGALILGTDWSDTAGVDHALALVMVVEGAGLARRAAAERPQQVADVLSNLDLPPRSRAAQAQDALSFWACVGGGDSRAALVQQWRSHGSEAIKGDAKGDPDRSLYAGSYVVWAATEAFLVRLQVAASVTTRTEAEAVLGCNGIPFESVYDDVEPEAKRAKIDAADGDGHKPRQRAWLGWRLPGDAESALWTPRYVGDWLGDRLIGRLLEVSPPGSREEC